MYKTLCYLFCAAFLCGCKPVYLITPQDKLVNSPCITGKTGINVRVRNSGKITITQVVLKGTKLAFPGLKPGQVSCYKNTQLIYSNPTLDVVISKQEGYKQTLMLVSVDHIGESQITQGYATINIMVTKIHGKLNASYNVIRDPVPL